MITPEQVETLLSSDADDPTLIVTGGAATVVPASELDTERYRGAVEVISRQDLVARLGGDTLSRHGLEEIAARLDSMVTRLGA
jgi:hypothetical protein